VLRECVEVLLEVSKEAGFHEVLRGCVEVVLGVCEGVWGYAEGIDEDGLGLAVRYLL
jgi:hypothetical protein